jgi:hypothetical protein
VRLRTFASLRFRRKKAGYWDDPTAWRYYGDQPENWATVGNQQSRAEQALIEKARHLGFLDFCRPSVHAPPFSILARRRYVGMSKSSPFECSPRRSWSGLRSHGEHGSRKRLP